MEWGGDAADSCHVPLTHSSSQPTNHLSTTTGESPPVLPDHAVRTYAYTITAHKMYIQTFPNTRPNTHAPIKPTECTNATRMLAARTCATLSVATAAAAPNAATIPPRAVARRRAARGRGAAAPPPAPPPPPPYAAAPGGSSRETGSGAKGAGPTRAAAAVARWQVRKADTQRRASVVQEGGRAWAAGGGGDYIHD